MDHVGTWRAGAERYPRLVPDYHLDPTRTALVIIDVQNRTVKPEYRGIAALLEQKYPEVSSYYLERAWNVVVPNNLRLLEFFRAHGLRVVFTTVGPVLPDGRDWVSPLREGFDAMERETGVRAMHPVGTPGHALIDELRPRSGELVIHKTTSSAFTSTGIDLTLRTLGIDTLICSGLVTNACVEMTARDAADRGYKVVMVDDACLTFDRELHDACLRAFAIFLGNVRSTAEVLAELGTAARRERAEQRASEARLPPEPEVMV